MTFGSELTEADFADLAARAIDRDTAIAAGLRHFDHFSGKELIGANGSGNYEGIGIPIHLPGNGDHPVAWRLRRRNPEIDARTGKPLRKYLGAPGERNRIYFPRNVTVEDLNDPTIPLLWTEGELKVLSLWRLACAYPVNGKPRFIPLGVFGVNNFRCTTGKTTNEHGERVPVKDVLPDFDRIAFQGRDNLIAYDSDITTKVQVRKARWAFSVVLRERGANVGYLEWPEQDGKGIDDWLAKVGPDVVLKTIANVRFDAATGWKARLLCTETGKPKGLFANALIALRHAPEWEGVLRFNEFSFCPVIVNPPPWGDWAQVGHAWTDNDTRLACAWLQANHIEVSISITSEAIQAAAQQDKFHPVREYLESLHWDGEPRVDMWLTRYLGVEASNYTSAVGRRWLISAVARIMKPGCKADCCLILEGPQGLKKSSALMALGGDWFTDEIAEFGSKDASLQMSGVWIIELGELDCLSRSEGSRIKAFMSRSTDRFRPPYGRHVIESPRQCVFAGTVNHSTYLRDETGARRFWPVECHDIDLAALEQDRDQLWAEALTLYDDDHRWWLETDQLNKEAELEQKSRYRATRGTNPFKPTRRTDLTYRSRRF
jgi:hypothetical protein